MTCVHPRRRAKNLTRAAIFGWAALGGADLLALLRLVPWMPMPLHNFIAAAAVTTTLLAAWMRYQAPVRAAFLDGMLHERANPGRLKAAPMPMASGDDTGGGRVIDFQRPTGGAHRTRRAFWPQDPNRH